MTKDPFYDGENYTIFPDGRIYNEKKKEFQRLFVDKDGYLMVSMYRKVKKVARVIADTFIDNPNNYEIVSYKDNDRKNCDYKNLEWTTRVKTAKKAVKRGTLVPPLKKAEEKRTIYVFDEKLQLIDTLLGTGGVSRKYDIALGTIYTQLYKKRKIRKKAAIGYYFSFDDKIEVEGV